MGEVHCVYVFGWIVSLNPSLLVLVEWSRWCNMSCIILWLMRYNMWNTLVWWLTYFIPQILHNLFCLLLVHTLSTYSWSYHICQIPSYKLIEHMQVLIKWMCYLQTHRLPSKNRLRRNMCSILNWHTNSKYVTSSIQKTIYIIFITWQCRKCRMCPK